MTINEKQAMSSAYKAQVAKYGTPISEELFRELREYANARKIRLSGFKDFVGDIQTIKTVIDDIIEIAGDFPRILDERQGIVLDLDYGMPDEDFATTYNGHVIHLNAGLYGDLQRLDAEYKAAVDRGDFVANTDWRAVARHESGHRIKERYGRFCNSECRVRR